MSPEELERARVVVEQAEARTAADDARRTAGSARHEAIRRTHEDRQRSGLARFVFDNGLALAATALFVVSFVGQLFAGRADYNGDRESHGRSAVSMVQYLSTGAFLEATAENWESEFLQMGLFVMLTAFLYQRGSSESKKIGEAEAVDQPPEEAAHDRGAPWPVRRGGVALLLYKHSLSLALFALFAVSFTLHGVGGAAAYNEEQARHGGEAISTLAYFGTSRLWFESFQNWQSEFMSVAVLVLLSIWLREQGSPQSKPVGAPHGETGE